MAHLSLSFSQLRAALTCLLLHSFRAMGIYLLLPLAGGRATRPRTTLFPCLQRLSSSATSPIPPRANTFMSITSLSRACAHTALLPYLQRLPPPDPMTVHPHTLIWWSLTGESSSSTLTRCLTYQLSNRWPRPLASPPHNPPPTIGLPYIPNTPL